jgi:hypothetical protein
LVLLVARGKQSAQLKWEDTSDNKDTKKIVEMAPDVTNYVDQNACYAVIGFNSAGEPSPSNRACLLD